MDDLKIKIMWPEIPNSGNYHWGVIAFRVNRLGFKETSKIPCATDVPYYLQQQGWKFWKKF